MIHDTWHVIPDTWHLTPDTGHLTHDIWQTVEGEYSLKISAVYYLVRGFVGKCKFVSKKLYIFSLPSFCEDTVFNHFVIRMVFSVQIFCMNTFGLPRLKSVYCKRTLKLHNFRKEMCGRLWKPEIDMMKLPLALAQGWRWAFSRGHFQGFQNS